MALALSVRPDAWSAARNPIAYTFTTTGGPFVNYRIEVELFNAVDDTSLSNGVKFAYPAGLDGTTRIDVSEIIRAHFVINWVAHGGSSVNNKELTSSMKFYLKYQELYEGSATSVVGDVANPRRAVNGALQIPSIVGSNMNAYVPTSSIAKFLHVLDSLKMWRGYPFYLSFIYPEAYDLTVVRKQYGLGGILIKEAETLLLKTAVDDNVNRLDILRNFVLDANAKTFEVQLRRITGLGSELAVNGTFTGSATPWVNLSSGIQWVYNDLFFRIQFSYTAPAQQSSILAQFPIVGLVSPNIFQITFNWGRTAGSGSTDFWLYAQKGGLATFLKSINGSGSSGSIDSGYVQLPAGTDGIGIRAVITSMSSAGNLFMDNISLKEATLIEATVNMSIKVLDPCDNPVYLFWKNTVGGDTFWMFDINQERTSRINGSSRIPRKLLFADELTLAEWEMIDDLNTGDDTYENAIPAVWVDTNKTQTKIGQQIYAIDSSGNKIGCVIVPKSPVTNTRQLKHKIEIEIELPAKL